MRMMMGTAARRSSLSSRRMRLVVTWMPLLLLKVLSVHATLTRAAAAAAATTSTGRTYDSFVVCITDLRNADANEDEEVTFPEYYNMLNSIVETYGYCRPSDDNMFVHFQEASCLCAEYYPSLNATEQERAPSCNCGNIVNNMALPDSNIYPAEYTRRICELLQQFLDTSTCPPTVAPPVPTTNEDEPDNEAEEPPVAVEDTSNKDGNTAIIAAGIVVPLLLLVAAVGGYYYYYHSSGDRASRGKNKNTERSDPRDNDNHCHGADSSTDEETAMNGNASDRIGATLGNVHGTHNKSKSEDTDRTLEDSDEENNELNESVAGDNSDVVLEVLNHGQEEHHNDISEDDFDDDEDDDGDDDEEWAENEEQDGFDPGSLFALTCSRLVKSDGSLSPRPDPPSSSQPVRKKKKKSTTLKSAKKVRAEYKKKLQHQRRSLRAIPERNLTLI